MKKYFISLLISLLCIFTPSAVLSGNNYKGGEHNDSGESSTQEVMSYSVIGKDSTSISPDSLKSLSGGAVITIHTHPSAVKNKNYFSYNGTSELVVDDQLITVLDSLVTSNNQFKEDMLSHLNTLIELEENNIMREQDERLFEAKAYQIFPISCIISLFFIFILNLGEGRLIYVFQNIFALIFVATLLGTIYFLPVLMLIW